MAGQLKDTNYENANSGAGYVDAGAFALGGNIGIQVILAATRTRTTTALNQSSVTITASNNNRYATRVVNTSTTANLWISATGAAVVGAGQKVPPGNSVLVNFAPSSNNSAGGAPVIGLPATAAITGIWDAAGSGNAIVDDISV